MPFVAAGESESLVASEWEPAQTKQFEEKNLKHHNLLGEGANKRPCDEWISAKKRLLRTYKPL